MDKIEERVNEFYLAHVAKLLYAPERPEFKAKLTALIRSCIDEAEGEALSKFKEAIEAMRVLVACEFSGIVRDAFAKRGHDAWSCDLLPTERPGNHILRKDC